METLTRRRTQLQRVLVLSLFSIFWQFTDVVGIIPLPVHEKPLRFRPIPQDGVPFVPEEYRDISNAIFSRMDFREITAMTEEQSNGLESELLQMIKNETENNRGATAEEIFLDAKVKYVGRGLWTNNGRNARLAVTLEGFVCGSLDENAKCHTKRCHMELNETFLPPPWPLGEDINSRRQNLSILRWSCARKERWCYVCRSPAESDPNGDSEIEDGGSNSWPICTEEDPENADESLFKLNCNRQYGDLGRSKRYACSVAFTQVAGITTEIQSRFCQVVEDTETSGELGNCQTDAIGFSSLCTCHKSGCNGNIFVKKKLESSFYPVRDDVTKEIHTSIRQLRSDIERMIKRYSTRN